MTERREIVIPREVQVGFAALAGALALYALRGVLMPLFIALAIAYVLDPLVDRLERFMPRGAAIVVTVLATVGVLVSFLSLVVPRVVSEVASALAELPGQARALLERLEPDLARFGVRVPHSDAAWMELVQRYSEVGVSMIKPAGAGLGAIALRTFSAVGAVAAGLVVPVFAIYFLYDFDRMVAGAHALVPWRYRDQVAEIFSEVHQILSQFLRGQVTVMAILGVLFTVAYSAIGLRLAVPIGLAAGVLHFIPYLGGAFALTSGLLMVALGGGGWSQALLVGAAYAVIQSLEGFVITPRIVGKTVGLPEVWALLALFVGGELFGFAGVLLALPTAAVLKIFVQRGLRAYLESTLFNVGAPLPEPPDIVSLAPPAPSLGPPPGSPADGRATDTPITASPDAPSPSQRTPAVVPSQRALASAPSQAAPAPPRRASESAPPSQAAPAPPRRASESAPSQAAPAPPRRASESAPPRRASESAPSQAAPAPPQRASESAPDSDSDPDSEPAPDSPRRH